MRFTLFTACALLAALAAGVRPAPPVQPPPPFWTDAADFGAKGDGRADDTAAIQRAVDAAGVGGRVRLRPGTYRTTAPLAVRDTRGLTLSGSGGRYPATTLAYDGPDGSPCVLIDGSDFITVEGLHVYPGPRRVGIRLVWGNRPAALNPCENTVRDCVIEGTGGPSAPTLAGVLNGDGSNQSVSEFRLEHTLITGCVDGLVVNSGNGQNQWVRDCRFTFNRDTGIHVKKGWLNCTSTLFGGHPADVRIDDGFGVSKIDGCYTEASDTFVATGGPSATPHPLMIAGCGIAGVKHALAYQLGGPVVLSGNLIAYGADVFVCGGQGAGVTCHSFGNHWQGGPPTFQLPAGAGTVNLLGDHSQTAGVTRRHAGMVLADDGGPSVGFLNTRAGATSAAGAVWFGRGAGPWAMTRDWQGGLNWPTPSGRPNFYLWDAVTNAVPFLFERPRGK